MATQVTPFNYAISRSGESFHSLFGNYPPMLMNAGFPLTGIGLEVLYQL
jgi:hypothetical protein